MKKLFAAILCALAFGANAQTINLATQVKGTFSGCASTRIVFNNSTPVPTCSANLIFDSSSLLLTVGTGSGTSSGVTLGYYGASGNGALWSTATATPSTTNYNIVVSASDTTINAPTTDLNFRVANTLKGKFTTTAGSGFAITAGTAASAVSALSITQTWNYNTTAIQGVDWAFTDTSSHASTLAWRVRGGASGTTLLASLAKDGVMIANTFQLTSTPITNPGTGNSIISGDANTINMFVGSALAVQFRAPGTSSAGIALPTAGMIGWGGTSPDTGLSRCAAAVACAGNGTAGDFTGTLKLTTLTGGTALTLTNAAAGTLTIGANAVTPASTGTRYLCISTAGVVSSSAAACAGT